MKNIIILMAIIITVNINAQNRDTLIINTKSFIQNRIPEHINGGFIEFLNDYINGKCGLWAQEFLNRGFDANSFEPFNLVDDWYLFEEEGVESYVRPRLGGINENGHSSQYYENYAKEGFGGVYQNVNLVDTVGHDFYVYFKGYANNDLLYLRIMDSSRNEIIREYELGILTDQWQKAELYIESIPNVYDFSFIIGIKGKGGIELDEASLIPENNIFGVRKEYFNLLDEWNIDVLKYPGGWFAETQAARWENGIGDIDQRKSTNISGNTPQRMDLGTIEFFNLCEALGTSPHIAVNYLFGDVEDALNWLEFIRGDQSTTFGKLRATLGRVEPFQIKLVEIGNERWDDPPNYAKGYIDFYDSIKVKYPDIEVMINGNNWEGYGYFKTIFDIIGDKTDVYTIHPLIGGPHGFAGPIEDEYYAVQAIPEFYSRDYYAYRNWIMERGFADTVTFGITEWWSSYADEGWLLDTNIRNSSLESALSNASYLMHMIKNPDLISIGERTVGIGLIRREFDSLGRKSIYGTGPYHALKLLNNHIGNHCFNVQVKTEYYSTALEGFFQGDNISYLDQLSTFDENNIYIALLNRHINESVTVEIFIDDLIIDPTNNKIDVFYISSDYFLDANTANEPDKITVKHKNIQFNGNIEIPKHSLYVLEIPKSSLIINSVSDADYNLKLKYNNEQSNLNIQYSSNLDLFKLNYNIFDINGKLVYEVSSPTELNSLEIDLPSGPYILNINSSNYNISQLFFVVK